MLDKLLGLVILGCFSLSAGADITTITGTPTSAPVTPTSISPSNKDCEKYWGSDGKQENLEAYPGFGWDNLRNLPMAAVFDMYSFSQCRMSPDRQHIVPDYVDVVSVKKTSFDRFAEYHKDFRDYFKAYAQAINLHPSLKFKNTGISGRFTKHFQEMKKTTLSTGSSIMKTSMKIHSYTLVATPEAPLAPDFKDRLLGIGEALRLNKTNLANYLSQLVVRDYGTHVVTRVDAGAYLTQEDYVDKVQILGALSSISEAQAAAATFFYQLLNTKIATGRVVSSSDLATYQSILYDSKLYSEGGLDISRLSDSTDWFNSSISDLVALNRLGDPIYWYISELQVPELPVMIINNISDYVRDAVHTYYKKNTIKGCTNPSSPNFKYLANVDDGTCDKPYSNYSFGGMYQTCRPVNPPGSDYLCNGYEVDNANTNIPACPPDYTPVLLISDTVQLTAGSYVKCYTEYYSCWQHLWIWPCSRRACFTKWWFNYIEYQVYWCQAVKQIPQNSGFLFGGAYGHGDDNQLTGESTCPDYFTEFDFGGGDYSFSVCMSQDLANAGPYGAPFSEFLNYDVPCKPGYSKHSFSESSRGETLSYCIRPMKMNIPDIARIKSPPFMKIPYDDQALLGLHSYPDGRLWAWDPSTVSWIQGQSTNLNGSDILDQYINATSGQGNQKQEL